MESQFQIDKKFAELVSGLKVFVATLLVIAAYLATRIIFKLENFENIFSEMLGSKPLPGLTRVVLRNALPIQVLSVIAPIAGLVCLFLLKSPRRALIASSLSLVVIFLLAIICNQAAFEPMIQIITEMNSDF